MSSSVLKAIPELCTECNGFVEPEILSVNIDAKICFDCLEEVEIRHLERDLGLVQEMNRSLLPRRVQEITSWDIGIHYQPARILSGDFYDLLPHHQSDTVGVTVGDIAGKGIPAGMLRTSLQATMRVLDDQQLPPSMLLEQANQYFLEYAHPGRFASVFYGVLENGGGSLSYANGGHLPPLLRRTSGSWEMLESTGTVLGVVERSRYQQHSCSLARGDLLLLFTDGITEAQAPSGEYFDDLNLTATVDRLAGRGAQEIADRVAAGLNLFSPGRPSDDRTLVVLRRC